MQKQSKTRFNTVLTSIFRRGGDGENPRKLRTRMFASFAHARTRGPCFARISSVTVTRTFTAAKNTRCSYSITMYCVYKDCHGWSVFTFIFKTSNDIMVENMSIHNCMQKIE